MSFQFFNPPEDIEIPREMEKVTRCLICDDGRQKLLFWGEDDRYGYPGSFPIVECQKCGLIYLATRPLSSELSNIYQRFYAPQKKNSTGKMLKTHIKEKIKNSSLGNFVKYLTNPRENLYGSLSIKSGVRVLDIGSGLVLSEARRIIEGGGSWLGVEIDPGLSEIIEKTGLNCFCGTIEDFYQTNPIPFDYIILSQVLEHIYDPKTFLKIVRLLLHPNGGIILSCPNADSHLRRRYGQLWLNWHVPYHVAHYNKTTLSQMALLVGLQISSFITTTPSNWYYAQHKLGRGLSFDNRWLNKKIMPQRLLDFYLSKLYRLGQGDNLVAKLKYI